MEAYLLDTSALTPLIDSSHPRHAQAKAVDDALGGQPIYVSVVTLAEFAFGLELHQREKGTSLSNADRMLRLARRYPIIDVDRHTAAEYAALKAKLAMHYLGKPIKEHRERWVEDWIDRITGKALIVDDNDLWICAQALQMNFILIAGDKMNRIRGAESRLKLLRI